MFRQVPCGIIDVARPRRTGFRVSINVAYLQLCYNPSRPHCQDVQPVEQIEHIRCSASRQAINLSGRQAYTRKHSLQHEHLTKPAARERQVSARYHISLFISSEENHKSRGNSNIRHRINVSRIKKIQYQRLCSSSPTLLGDEGGVGGHRIH